MSSQGLVVPVLRNVERMNYADVEKVPDTVWFIVAMYIFILGDCWAGQEGKEQPDLDWGHGWRHFHHQAWLNNFGQIFKDNIMFFNPFHYTWPFPHWPLAAMAVCSVPCSELQSSTHRNRQFSGCMAFLRDLLSGTARWNNCPFCLNLNLLHFRLSSGRWCTLPSRMTTAWSTVVRLSPSLGRSRMPWRTQGSCSWTSRSDPTITKKNFHAKMGSKMA